MRTDQEHMKVTEQIIKEHVLQIEDVAFALKINTKTAREKLRAGEIPACKRGREWYVKTSDLIAYMSGDIDQDEDDDEDGDDLYIDDPLELEDAAELLGYEDGDSLLSAIEAGEIDLLVISDEDGDLVCSYAAVEALFDDDEDEEFDEEDDEDDSWNDDDEDDDDDEEEEDRE